LRSACDAVCYGYGLAPATEITRLLGASHRYEPRSGGWAAITDADGLTDVEGLYVCGDGAGVHGAAAAALGGEITGQAVTASLGKAPPAGSRPSGLAQGARRAARFGRAMTALAMPPEGLLAAITAETLVCRCEGVTRAEIDGAIGAGAHTLTELKAMTRCGMGPCGGRVCEDSAAALIAQRTGKPLEAIGQGTARPPLRPVPLALIAGEFDYQDLPFPEPAPQ
jgi:bacterioferritin-associated ferredoxin